MEDWSKTEGYDDGASVIEAAEPAWTPPHGGPGSGRSGHWAYDGPQPVVAAMGMGVDSTAMAIEVLESGGRIDVALFADVVRSERPETYEYVPILKEYLDRFGVPLVVLRNEVKNYRESIKYDSLETSCLKLGNLPSIAYGQSTCSARFKQEPQARWIKAWKPAIKAWSQGYKVTKLIGFDASPRDGQRYENSLKHQDDLYDNRFPLRELGWNRDACEDRIRRAGLPVPPKSACFFCLATKPDELAALPKPMLRRIVLMESRAAPNLRNIEGLWRKTVKGMRGSTAKPGSMTTFIRERMLLPAEEISIMEETAVNDLVAFVAGEEGRPIEDRRSVFDWMRSFEGRSGLQLLT